MNVLCIGSGVVGADMAAELVRAFLAAEFDGGERYRRRLEKIEAMEKRLRMPESLRNWARSASVGSTCCPANGPGGSRG